MLSLSQAKSLVTLQAAFQSVLIMAVGARGKEKLTIGYYHSYVKEGSART